jgi:glutaredoxin-related protein
MASKRQRTDLYPSNFYPVTVDLTKHNSQYEAINIGTNANFHDRFLAIDDSALHIQEHP